MRAIRIHFDDEDFERLEAKAKETEHPIALLVRKAVKAWLGPAETDGDKRQAERLARIGREQGRDRT